MVITVVKNVEEPVYRQIRSQIIAAIASGELAVGQALPSVRRLAADLGINFHTVNKAYAVLRDEGYLVLRGRSGAFVAKPASADSSVLQDKLADDLAALATAFKARGGTAEQFLSCAESQACKAFGVAPADLGNAVADVAGAKTAAKAAVDAETFGAVGGIMGKTARKNGRKKDGGPEGMKAAAKGASAAKPAKKKRKTPAKQVEFVQLSLLGD